MLQANWKRFVGIGCLVCLMGLAALPVEAAFWGVALTVFTKVALDVTVDVISNFITESPNEQNIKELTRDVVELEEQLAVYEQQGNYDSQEDFAQVSQTVAALKQVLAGMDQRMASFDERLKRVESQMAVFRQAVQNAPPVERSTQGVGLAVNYVYRPGGQGEFQPLTEGGVMRSGDHYKIIFTPDADGYVYLFQTDSSGQIYRLFPLDTFKGVAVNLANPVKAGATYYVPAQGQSFRLDHWSKRSSSAARPIL